MCPSNEERSMNLLKRFLSLFFRRSKHLTVLQTIYPDDGSAAKTEILVVGESNCDHSFSKQKWNSGKFGADITDFSEYRATFKTHYKCKCGREVIRGSRSFY